MAGTGSIAVTAVRQVGDIYSTHQYDVDVKFRIAFDWGGYNNSGTATYSISCDGQSQNGTATFSVASGNGSWVWTDIATKTFRITMPTSGQPKTINFSATIDTKINPPTITASGTKSLDAVTWRYTLTIDPNTGSWNGTTNNSTVTQDYGTTKTIDNPTKEGHSFTGWSKSGSGSLSGATYTYGAGNCTLTANWRINQYRLTINPNGGTWGGTTSNSTADQNYHSTKSIANPTRDGYRFTGWTLSGGGSLNGTTYTYGASNGTLTANWIRQYRLDVNIMVNDVNTHDSTTPAHFDMYINGSCVSQNAVDYCTNLDTGTTWEVKNITFDLGYTKYSNDTLKGTLSSATSCNIYIGKNYTITYYGNGGTINNADSVTQTVNYGTEWTTQGKVATRLGYDHLSWNTKEDGTGTVYGFNAQQTNKQTQNLDLYAIYEPVNIAYYKVGNNWKLAHTYYKVGTEWKPAIAFKKVNGTWKRSIAK